jgi:EAL domain-containing protein (putative c-di-GMP-specific phosphodiesterase class I)
MKEFDKKKQKFHVIVVEVPQLKEINMLFGMDFGDLFLCTIAAELRRILNSRYVFRLSSKRFLMLTSSLAEYEQVRNQVHTYLKESVKIQNEQIAVAVVICGVIDAQKLGKSDALLTYIEYLIAMVPRSTETVLIQSDETVLKGFKYRKEIERFIFTAVEENLFEVYYQPIYSVEEKKYVALEALSRLRHPNLGPISPEVFIDIAEHSGQIALIDQIQFRNVCNFMKEHPEILEEIRYIKVNLSPAELLREGYSRKLIETIRESGLPCTSFQFEITETMATKYTEELYHLIADFTGCGITLSLDDFGSGYANLDAVLKIPFSSIKLDRSLLHGIMVDEKSMLFYKNIVAIMKSMGYVVIAEGVELEKEVELLTSWGVDMIQGFYFSKPMSENAVLESLEEWKCPI